jgi:hypothetical protein
MIPILFYILYRGKLKLSSNKLLTDTWNIFYPKFLSIRVRSTAMFLIQHRLACNYHSINAIQMRRYNSTAKIATTYIY